MTDVLGNEENLAKVRELMAQKSDIVSTGSALKTTIPIDYTSSEGNVYRGDVTFKRLSVFEILKASAIKSEILARAGVKNIKLVDDIVLALAQVIATLRVAVVKAPDWLELTDLTAIREADLLFFVEQVYTEWENSFRLGRYRDSGDSKASATEEAVDAP